MRMTVLALVLFSAGACAKRPSADPAAGGGAPPEISKTTFAPSLGVDLAAMRQTARGVYFRDIAEGTGDPVVTGAQVAIHYAGTFPDGRQFDANGPADPPFVFRLGAGEVVPGFDEGIVGMKIGGKRLLIIPPALGYGPEDNGPIPGNSILVFVIDLVRVQ